MAIIYCGSHGLLRSVPVDNVRAFEKAYLQTLQVEHDLLARLREGKLLEEDEKVLQAVLRRPRGVFKGCECRVGK